jgi:hypothetical protein
MYLLDTNVLSEVRRTRPHGAVVAWLRSIPDTELFVPAVSAGEIQSGIEATRRTDSQKALEIERWLDLVLRTYRVLPMDGAAFRRWSRIMLGVSRDHLMDGMIAAIALEHRLTVATRNTDDFTRFNVPLINPFEAPRA